jgi:hypothetical protein
MIPAFEYSRSEPDQRFGLPRRWLPALSATGRFFRSNDGAILFLVSEPGEFVKVTRRDELRSILEDAGVIRLVTPHPMEDNDFMSLWVALNDWRWKLPAASKRKIPTAQTVRS